MEVSIKIDDLVIRELSTKEEESKAISFLNDKLNHTVTPISWNWEHYDDQSVLGAIFRNSEILGTQTMIPISIAYGNQIISSAKSENSYLDHSCKGKGLFEKLYFYTIDVSKSRNIKLLWGFTSAIKVFRDKLKYHHFVNSTKNSYLFIGIQIPKGLNKLFFIQLLGFIYFKILSLQHYFKSKTLYSSLENLKSDNDLVEFYNQIQLKGNAFYHLNMSNEFLNWRVYNNPNLNYIHKYFYLNDTLVGYYIASIEGINCNLNDFNFKDKSHGIQIFKYLLQELGGKSIKRVNYIGNRFNAANKAVFDLLKSYGAIEKENFNWQFIVKDIIGDGSVNNIYNIENWYYNGLWSEGYSF